MSLIRWMRTLLLGVILTTSLLPARGLAIVGGHDSDIKDWPSMVALMIQPSPQHKLAHFCGGVLIAPKWVLTAGSCLFDLKSERQFLLDVRVFMGRTHLVEYAGKADGFIISNVFIHPGYGYQFTNHANDLALLKLEKPVALSRVTQTAALATAAELSKATDTVRTVTALGWGRTSEEPDFSQQYKDDPFGMTHAGSNTLRQVSLPLISAEKCKQQFNGAIVMDKLICAGREEGGVDTCIGDTGGPLYLEVGGKQKLVGITNFGMGCARAQSPGLYANVPDAMKWIESVIAKN